MKIAIYWVYSKGGDTIHFGADTLKNSAPLATNRTDLFLVKFDHKGNVIWAKQTFNLDSNRGYGISGGRVNTDLAGNVYLASDFPDTLIIGTDTLVNSKGYGHSYIVKFDSSGNIKWIERSTGTNKNSYTGGEYTTCDVKGNVYLSGAFTDTVYFGDSIIIGTSSMYYFNSFLVKYDSSGNVKWAKQSKYSGDNSSDVSYCNANDRFGNSFLTGSFGDTVSFGSYSLYGGNNSDFYLVKYDSNGNVKWVKQNTQIGAGGSIGISVVADQTGNAYATGQFSDTIIFGHDTFSSLNGSFFW